MDCCGILKIVFNYSEPVSFPCRAVPLLLRVPGAARQNTTEASMCVTLIGGMDRLKKEYIAAAREGGATLKCIHRNERNFEDKIGTPDAIIVFTNKISHEARRKAIIPSTSLNTALPSRTRHHAKGIHSILHEAHK